MLTIQELLDKAERIMHLPKEDPLDRCTVSEIKGCLILLRYLTTLDYIEVPILNKQKQEVGVALCKIQNMSNVKCLLPSNQQIRLQFHCFNATFNMGAKYHSDISVNVSLTSDLASMLQDIERQIMEFYTLPRTYTSALSTLDKVFLAATNKLDRLDGAFAINFAKQCINRIHDLAEVSSILGISISYLKYVVRLNNSILEECKTKPCPSILVDVLYALSACTDLYYAEEGAIVSNCDKKPLVLVRNDEGEYRLHDKDHPVYMRYLLNCKLTNKKEERLATF